MTSSIVLLNNYDIDNLTGFLPRQPPLECLEGKEAWEQSLDSALKLSLQPGSSPNITQQQIQCSEDWRARVRVMPILSIEDLDTLPQTLHRAHHVLAFIMHFYIHSLPPDSSVLIPASVSVPITQVSAKLQIPPVLTYADNVLWNWRSSPFDTTHAPSANNLRSQTTFTGTDDEQQFYLTSARIELRGVEALKLVSLVHDHIPLSSDDDSPTSFKQVAEYLNRMSLVIDELKQILQTLPNICNPKVYFTDVRPWFNGEDSNHKPWTFEGVENTPRETSGPSAGQSSLIHVLSIFLGVEQYTPSIEGETPKPSFMKRMLSYMPFLHRQYLNHLSAKPRPLRAFVMSASHTTLLNAYNLAVRALKEFRDAHLIITTLYVIAPARRHADEKYSPSYDETLKGTGGSDLVKFLKGTRDLTAQTILQ